MDGCSVVQAYKNTHCTDPEHYVPTEHVDLGMRNKAGARCFPVDSYKISRTENYYTVFRSELGSACFDTVCKGRKLYIRIPATSEHPQADIPCPSGKKIDLSDYDLGFEEGTIGPCPNNRLICESWGYENVLLSKGMITRLLRLGQMSRRLQQQWRLFRRQMLLPHWIRRRRLRESGMSTQEMQ